MTDVGKDGTVNDMAYDAEGNLHLAWYDVRRHNLKYARQDAATGGWETTASGGNLLGTSLTDWKFLHGGEASVTFRVAFDSTANTYFLNTVFGPNTGSGIWMQWIGSLGFWNFRVDGTQRNFVAASVPTAGQMYVVTYTWAADGSAKVYLDGVEVASWVAGSFTYNTNDQSSKLVIGSAYQTGLNSSDMTVTDVIIGTEYVDATQALAFYDGLDGLRS